MSIIANSIASTQAAVLRGRRQLVRKARARRRLLRARSGWLAGGSGTAHRRGVRKGAVRRREHSAKALCARLRRRATRAASVEGQLRVFWRRWAASSWRLDGGGRVHGGASWWRAPAVVGLPDMCSVEETEIEERLGCVAQQPGARWDRGRGHLADRSSSNDPSPSRLGAAAMYAVDVPCPVPSSRSSSSADSANSTRHAALATDSQSSHLTG